MAEVAILMILVYDFPLVPIVTTGLSSSILNGIEEFQHEQVLMKISHCVIWISRVIHLHRVHIASATGMSINSRDDSYLETTSCNMTGNCMTDIKYFHVYLAYAYLSISGGLMAEYM